MQYQAYLRGNRKHQHFQSQKMCIPSIEKPRASDIVLRYMDPLSADWRRERWVTKDTGIIVMATNTLANCVYMYGVNVRVAHSWLKEKVLATRMPIPV